MTDKSLSLINGAKIIKTSGESMNQSAFYITQQSSVSMLCNIRHYPLKINFELGIQNEKNRTTLQSFIQSFDAQMFRSDTNPVPDF